MECLVPQPDPSKPVPHSERDSLFMVVQVLMSDKKNLLTIGTFLISVLVPGSELSVSGSQELERQFLTNHSPLSTEKCIRWLLSTHMIPLGKHGIQDCLGYKNLSSHSKHMAFTSLEDLMVFQASPKTTSIRSDLTTDTTRE